MNISSYYDVVEFCKKYKVGKNVIVFGEIRQFQEGHYIDFSFKETIYVGVIKHINYSCDGFILEFLVSSRPIEIHVSIKEPHHIVD